MSSFHVKAICGLLEQFASENSEMIEDHVEFFWERKANGSILFVAKPKTPQGHDLINRMKALDPTEH